MARPRRERRNSLRYSLQLPVTAKLAGNNSHDITGVTRDMSMDGVYFYAASPLPVSSAVELRVTLTGGPVHRRLPLRFLGTVVRVEQHESDQKFGIAVQF